MSIILKQLLEPGLNYNNGKKIAMDSTGILYCCFYTKININYQIFVYKSEDRGKTWTDMNFPQITNYSQQNPSLVVDKNDNLHVTWMGYDVQNPNYTQIKYSKYTNGSWSSWMNIQFNQSGRTQFSPSIAVDNNNKLHITWHGLDDDNPNYTQIKYSNNVSGSWSMWKNIQSIPGYMQQNASIAIDSNNKVHISWHGKDTIMPAFNQIKYSNNVSGSWSTQVNIQTIDGSNQNYCNIAIDNNNKIHIVWHGCDPINLQAAQIKYSNNVSGVWSSWINVQTFPDCAQYYPSISIDSSNKLHVFWMGLDNVNSTKYQIKYSNTLKGTWSDWDGWSDWRNETGNTLYSYFCPSCICRNDIVNFVYSSETTIQALGMPIRETTNSSFSSEIIVGIPVRGVTLDKTITTINKGNKITLISSILPSNATNQKITWSSSDTSIATVNSSGVVTAINQGSCTITVTTAEKNFTASCTINVKVPVTGILLNKSFISLIRGKTDQLIAKVLPVDATNQNYSFSSSDITIAKVSSFGVITAIGVGTCTITATAEDQGFIANCDITVTAPIISVTGITLDKSIDYINVGKNETLTATVLPETATNQLVIWNSSNTNIATVNASGLIIAKAVGNCIITAMTSEKHYTANCNVNVIISVQSVMLNKKTDSITAGETTNLVASVFPSNSTNQNITWTSSDTNIATVDSNGLVTGISGGSCTITATSEDGNKTASCIITVIVAVSGILLNKRTDTITKGKTDQLIATIYPSDATNQSITWKSSNTNIATVDSNGLVTGISTGSCTITAISVDGNKFVGCTVNVIIPVINITLDKSSDSIALGDKDTLIATIVPSNATNKNVTWTSSDTNIATVDNYGVVTAKAYGICTITVTTVDGNKIASCNIIISIPVKSIIMASSYVSVKIGIKTTLNVIINPTNATNKLIYWESSNPAIATVNGLGEVIGVKVGVCTMTATSADGNKTASCTIIVSK